MRISLITADILLVCSVTISALINDSITPLSQASTVDTNSNFISATLYLMAGITKKS